MSPPNASPFERAPIRRIPTVNMRVVPPPPRHLPEKPEPKRPLKRNRPSSALFLYFEFNSPTFAGHVYRLTNGRATELTTLEDARGSFSSFITRAGDHFFLSHSDPTLTTYPLLRSSDQGRTWEASFADVGDKPPGISGVGDTIYLAEGANNQIHKSTDGGANWSTVAAIATIENRQGFSLAVNPNDTDHLLLYGYEETGTSDYSPRIGVSTNGGSSFDYQALGTDSDFGTFFNAVGFTSSGSAVVVFEDLREIEGFGTTLIPRYGYSANGAADSFTLADLPSVAAEGSQEEIFSFDPGVTMQVLPDDEVLVSANGGGVANQIHVLRSTDGGQTFEVAVSGVTGENEGGHGIFTDRGLRGMYMDNHFADVTASTRHLLFNPKPFDGGDWQTVIEGDGSDFEPAWAQSVVVIPPTLVQS